MKSFMRNAFLGAAGLVALSLSANAAGTTAVSDIPAFKSPTTTTKSIQVTQYGTSSGSVGFKKAKKKAK